MEGALIGGHSKNAKQSAATSTTSTCDSIALLGVVVVTVAVTIPSLQQAEAAGCINPNAPAGGSIAANASKGRCAR